MKQGSRTIFPRDLFALFISPSTIGYWHLVHSTFQLGKLCGNLWLEAETIRFDHDFFKKGCSKGLETRFHVSEIQIRKDVGKDGQKLVSHVMPEK